MTTTITHVAAKSISTSLGRLGCRSGGTGSTVLMLTGFGASIDDWHPDLIDALAAHRTVLVADHPGVGLSDIGASPMSIANLAVRMAALIDEYCAGPVDLIGWSMGGMVAQSLAVQRPELIRTIVLAAAAPGIRGTLDPTAGAATALTGTPTGLLDILFPTDRDAGEAYVRAISRYGTRAVVPATVLAAQREAIRLWRSGADPSARSVARLTLRVLIAGGGLDVINPPENDELLFSAIPHAERAVWPTGGHGFLFEDPAGFADRVVDFWHEAH